MIFGDRVKPDLWLISLGAEGSSDLDAARIVEILILVAYQDVVAWWFHYFTSHQENDIQNLLSLVLGLQQAE